jgi:hypothetical protein
MQHLLFSDDLHPVEPDQHINISIWGTEQGLQPRIAYNSSSEPTDKVILTDEEEAAAPKWLTRDAFSISYTEVVSLSYDIEQGKSPKEPYGVVDDHYTYYLGPPQPL